VTVTNTNDSGAGSLRAAVAAAAPGDTINFSVVGKIVLTSGPILINKPLTIAGPDPKLLTISGNSTSRIFAISDGNLLTDSPVTIAGLTVSEGHIGDCVGAVLDSGGAVGSSESLSLIGVIVRDSFASGNGGGLAFGPTMTGQSLTIQNSQFL